MTTKNLENVQKELYKRLFGVPTGTTNNNNNNNSSDDF